MTTFSSQLGSSGPTQQKGLEGVQRVQAPTPTQVQDATMVQVAAGGGLPQGMGRRVPGVTEPVGSAQWAPFAELGTLLPAGAVILPATVGQLSAHDTQPPGIPIRAVDSLPMSPRDRFEPLPGWHVLPPTFGALPSSAHFRKSPGISSGAGGLRWGGQGQLMPIGLPPIIPIAAGPQPQGGGGGGGGPIAPGPANPPGETTSKIDDRLEGWGPCALSENGRDACDNISLDELFARLVRGTFGRFELCCLIWKLAPKGDPRLDLAPYVDAPKLEPDETGGEPPPPYPPDGGVEYGPAAGMRWAREFLLPGGVAWMLDPCVWKVCLAVGNMSSEHQRRFARNNHYNGSALAPPATGVGLYPIAIVCIWYDVCNDRLIGVNTEGHAKDAEVAEMARRVELERRHRENEGRRQGGRIPY